MITTRGDYRYVTIPYSILVDGDILPQRDMLSPALAVGLRSPLCLRGVDCAFLNESQLERYTVAANPSAAPSYTIPEYLLGAAMGKTVPRCATAGPDDWDSDWGPANGLWSYLGRFLTQLPEAGVYQGMSIGAFDLGRAFNSRVDADDLAARSLQFFGGTPLRGDEVRKIYRDYTKLRTLEVGNRKGDFSGWTWNYSANGYGMESVPSGAVIYRKTARNLKGGNYEWMSGDETWQVRTADPEVPLNAPAQTELAEAAALVVAAQIKTVLSGDRSGTWTDTAVMRGRLGSRGAGLANLGSLTQAAADLRTAHNASVPGWSSLAEGATRMVTQTLEYLRAAATLGSHTDISGIGWNWQP